MRRWMTAALLAGAAIASRPAGAGESSALFRIEDPRGDDHGDGALVFPLRDDLRPGDLDLVSLVAWPDPRGTRFEATFARPIARPGARALDVTGAPLSSVAKLGFYTFNLEIYIDTDRVPGSGLTAMLPGRKAEVAPASAWERLIVLAPRPHETRGALRRMSRSALMLGLKQASSSLEDRVLFVTRVQVSGSTLRFVVPTSFLGGPARPGWGYVVAVSGADLMQRLDLPVLGLPGIGGLERLAIIPIEGGPGTDRFGGAREGDPLVPPLVDIAVPPGQSQEAILRGDDPATGRPVRLPAVVPAGKQAPAAAPSGPPQPGSAPDGGAAAP